jgi:hypothetical protein
MTKGELKAQEYRSRAEDALVSAESASLDLVREQRHRAAAIWFSMAEAEDRRALEAVARLARQPAPVASVL